jgi:DNA-binding NtrC family response regulator
LVIDDDEDLRDALVMALTDEGYDVIGAGDMPGALEAARAHRPCVIVADLHLGGAGPHVVQKVREDFPDIALILASGASDLDRQAERLGARGALLKPFTVGQLVAAIQPYCR